MGEFVIAAEVHRDDWHYQAHFDALPWFEQASDMDIVELAMIDWGGDMEADAVAQWCSSDPKVAEVLDHTACEEDMGYECHVNEEAAMEWLRKNRPSVWECIKD